MNFKSILIIVIQILLITSCGHTQKTEDKTENHLLTITKAQFEANKMSFGKIQRISFDDIVKCNGNIVPKTNGMAQISTFISGSILHINISDGQKVTKGQTLFELGGNEIIELQRDFAETASQLKRAKTQYLRIKSLYEDNIGSEKEFISAETDYNSLNAKFSALKIQLQNVGLNPSNTENGEFKTTFLVKSPISGYISQINVAIGQHIEQQTNLAKVIDTQQLYLKLSVFEKDINTLRIGQNIDFKLSDNNKKPYSATLTSIGKAVNNDSRTVDCYATINDKNMELFVVNAFAEVNIQTKSDTVNALPEEAVLKADERKYILFFAKMDENNYYLNKIKVNTGRIRNGFIELIDTVEHHQILTKGVYNINIE